MSTIELSFYAYSYNLLVMKEENQKISQKRIAAAAMVVQAGSFVDPYAAGFFIILNVIELNTIPNFIKYHLF